MINKQEETDGFPKRISEAMWRADPINQEKLRKSFPYVKDPRAFDEEQAEKTDEDDRKKKRREEMMEE